MPVCIEPEANAVPDIPPTAAGTGVARRMRVLPQR